MTVLDGASPTLVSRNPKSSEVTAPPLRAYSVPAFCRAFHLGKTTVWAMIADGRLRSVKVGGRRLIPAEAADALLTAAE